MGKKYFSFWVLFTFLISFSWGILAQENNPRMLIHIMDYLAQDYAGAVSQGKIINSTEYQEQTELLASALRISKNLEETKNNSTLLEELENLQKAILNKQLPEVVAEQARHIQSQLIQVSKIEVSPREWPSLAKGEVLFAQNCVSCHGVKGQGDGPLAKNLNPHPANFWNEKRMSALSPFQIFNTVRLGID